MSKSCNIWLNGYSGRMGQEIIQIALTSPKVTLLGGSAENSFVSFQDEKTTEIKLQDAKILLTKSDVIIDFSSDKGNSSLFSFLESTNTTSKSFIIATTGISNEQKSLWTEICRKMSHKILFCPNTSLGVLLSTKICLEIAKNLREMNFDIEISETHHKNKLDSPSGTALYIAHSLAKAEKLTPITNRIGKRSPNEIGISSMRGGGILGEHSIKFLGDFEEITVSHRALSRSLFADGALKLAHWLQSQQNAGVYQLEDYYS